MTMISLRTFATATSRHCLQQQQWPKRSLWSSTRLTNKRFPSSSGAMAAMSTTAQQQQDSHYQDSRFYSIATAVVAAATAAGATTFLMTSCDSSSADYNSLQKEKTPAKVANDKFEDVVKHSEEIEDNFPIYTSQQVSENDGSDGKPIWMSYGGVVYDVTDFIANHPGGSEKILMAAGSVGTRSS